MRVLIVEDDREAAAFLAQGIEESGHEALCACDGREALRLALQGRFDTIVLDRMLPELDGLTVIAKLREQHIATPILILSALSDTDERITGLRAGGDDYLVKPFAFGELLVIAFGLCGLAFASGWGIAHFLQTDRAQRISLIFGLGMSNNGTGLVLASLALADHPRMMLPILIYNLFQHLLAGSADWALSQKGQLPI
ncbi:MAG: response regulator [Nitrococcus sp.]|nr:response regulator [Nitrococcus sp.]